MIGLGAASPLDPLGEPDQRNDPARPGRRARPAPRGRPRGSRGAAAGPRAGSRTTQSSGRTTSWAPAPRAEPIDSAIRAAFPSRSPTVGFICARARRRCADSAMRQVWPRRRLGCDAVFSRDRRGEEAHIERLCARTGSGWPAAPRAGARSAGAEGGSRSRSRRSGGRSPTSSRCTRSGTSSAAGARRPASRPRRTPGSGRSRTAPSSRPTPTLRSISRRLEGYLRWAQNRQHRRVPPRIPSREHPFWSLLRLGHGREAA